MIHYDLSEARLLRRVTSLLLLVMVSSLAYAQQSPSPFGRHFIVGFPHVVSVDASSLTVPLRTEVRLIIFSSEVANVTVRSTGFLRNVQVNPGASTVVSLTAAPTPAPKIFFDKVSTVARDVFDVVSDKDISIYCYFVTASGSEAFTPLPVEHWGTEYYSMNIRNTTVADVDSIGDEHVLFYDKSAPAQVLVIASEDGTDVKVDATGNVYAITQGPRVRTIRLNAGEAYLVESTSQNFGQGVDLSGTHITATKPVGVISGNARNRTSPVDGGLSGNTKKNPALEWLLPVDALGQTFVYRSFLPPILQNDYPKEIVRVYAVSPGTQVRSTNSNFPQSVLPGSFLEFSSTSNDRPFSITANKPVQAAVFTGSTTRDFRILAFDSASQEIRPFNGSDIWAPAMSRMVPLEQWIISGRFHAPSFPPALDNYIVITAEGGAKVSIDGSNVPLQGVPSTTFFHAWVPVKSGDHTITSTGGRFNAIAFGTMKGYERFAPPKTNKGGAVTQHPSIYDEAMGATYAYPVMGRQENVEAPAGISLCVGSTGLVTVNNTGSDALSLIDATVVDPTGAFSLGTIKFPVTIPSGGETVIPVTYDPARGSGTRAVVRYTVQSADRRRAPVQLETVVTLATPTAAHAHIGVFVSVTPGDVLTVPIILDDSLDAFGVTSMQLDIRYDTTMMRLLNGAPQFVRTALDSTIVRDWSIAVVQNTPGHFIATLQAPPGYPLRDTGSILALRFQTFIQLVDSTSLKWHDTSSFAFSLTIQSASCVEVATDPGFVQLQLCGLEQRLIEMFQGSYALEGNHPNPFNPTTEIDFSLGTEGPALLEIFNAVGDRVAVLVDERLQAGSYSITWDATAYPSGLYYCRLTSGEWSRTHTMMLVK